MSSLRYRFVGLESLQRALPTNMVEEYCKLDPAHIEAIKASPFPRKSRLSLALQVLFLSLTGGHPASAEAVPAAALRFVCRQLSPARRLRNRNRHPEIGGGISGQFADPP